MKKDNVITIEGNEEFYVCFSKKYVLDKKVSLSVPRGYVAIAYINGKPMYKSKQCVNENILSKCGKEFLGQEIQFAFYSPSIHQEMKYGCKYINVNNDRLKEAYRVGINGSFLLEIKDYIKLINNFPGKNLITTEDVREIVVAIVQTVATPILASYFANTSISVFEINSMVGELRQKILDALTAESALEVLGITVNSITVREIHVPEEDLEMIRSRINY